MSKYDIIIIGSGLGGLECGAILSKEGYHVCVVTFSAILYPHHIRLFLQLAYLPDIDRRNTGLPSSVQVTDARLRARPSTASMMSV